MPRPASYAVLRDGSVVHLAASPLDHAKRSVKRRVQAHRLYNRADRTHVQPMPDGTLTVRLFRGGTVVDQLRFKGWRA